MITAAKGYTPVEHDEPLPCPFCGSQPKLCQLAYRTRLVRRNRRYVQERVCVIASTETLTATDFLFKCDSCNASSGFYTNAAQKAVENWNRRAQPTGGAK